MCTPYMHIHMNIFVHVCSDTYTHLIIHIIIHIYTYIHTGMREHIAHPGSSGNAHHRDQKLASLRN